MAFWGVEVKPGKPFTHCCENARGRLRITQATIGHDVAPGAFYAKTIIQCKVGERSPVFLCALQYIQAESCHLDLEFEEPNDVVFSVIGGYSVYLTGYYVQKIRQSNPHSDTTEGSSYCGEDEKYDDSCINDGAELQSSPRSPVNNNGMGEKTPGSDKPKDKNDHGGQHRAKYGVIDSDVNATKREGEDEDDDKRAIETTTMSDDGKKDGVYRIEPKQKVDCLDTTLEIEGEKELPLDKEKTEVRNEKNELEAVEEINVSDEKVLTGDTIHENNAKDTINQMQSLDFEKPKKKRKKRSKKKKKTCNIQTDNASIYTINKGVLASDSQSKKKTKKKKKKTQEEKHLSMGLTNTTDSKETTPKNAAKRILSNGLIIEELARGPPDGKAAVPGNKVKIYYTAMLKETGHVFESNVGYTSYMFQLGDEDIIDGWNAGIDGMRVGDKRRLIVPPSMGFGNHGMGEVVPPNSWLVYEIELVGVRT